MMKRLVLLTATVMMFGFGGTDMALAAGKKKSEAAKESAKESAKTQETDEIFAEESMAMKLVADPGAAKEQSQDENLDPMAAATAQASDATMGDLAAAPPEPAKPAIDVNKAAESEIPVLANTKEVKRSAGGEYGRVLITLGVLAVLLGGASFAIRRFSAKKNGKTQNTRIKVLTQHYLGPKKSVAIIQVAGESILVGITDHNISMLKTLALIDDEVPEAVPQNFDTALDDYEEMQQYEAAEQTKRKKRPGSQRELEDFTVGGLSDIQDVVSTRLKNMKNF